MINLTRHSFKLCCYCLLLCCSCKELIEPSLSKRIIKPLAPADQYESPIFAVGFWWDRVEDALRYRLQVVSGTFSSPGQLIADTVIVDNKFTLNLDPGNYQWRVSAENGSSSTDFSASRNLTILASSIKGQAVRLTSPVDGLLTNNPAMLFAWSKLYGATKYRLQIDTNGFINEAKLVYNETVPSNSVTVTVARDQRYQWRVMAKNDTADARWSELRAVALDRTPPSKPEPSLPANRSFVSMPLTLKWSQSTGATKYRLSILKTDSVSSYNKNYPVDITTNSYVFNEGFQGENIVWKVFAIDAAGNLSEAGKTFSFTVQ